MAIISLMPRGGGAKIQDSKSAIASTAQQTINPDNGYDAMAYLAISIPANYSKSWSINSSAVYGRCAGIGAVGDTILGYTDPFIAATLEGTYNNGSGAVQFSITANSDTGVYYFTMPDGNVTITA